MTGSTHRGAPRLTKPLREAIVAALNAALAGEGFEGGDFDGMDVRHFERALDWIHERNAGSRRRASVR